MLLMLKFGSSKYLPHLEIKMKNKYEYKYGTMTFLV